VAGPASGTPLVGTAQAQRRSRTTSHPLLAITWPVVLLSRQGTQLMPRSEARTATTALQPLLSAASVGRWTPPKSDNVCLVERQGRYIGVRLGSEASSTVLWQENRSNDRTTPPLYACSSALHLHRGATRHVHSGPDREVPSPQSSHPNERQPGFSFRGDSSTQRAGSRPDWSPIQVPFSMASSTPRAASPTVVKSESRVSTQRLVVVIGRC